MVPARLPALLLVLLSLGLPAAACSRGAPSEADRLPWILLRDADHLAAELEGARRAGRPAIVEMSAAWCPPCRHLERHLRGDGALRERLARCVLLKIDGTDGDRPDLRRALGLPEGVPQMVFFGKDGERLPDLHLLGWDPREGPSLLERALDRMG